MGARATGCVAVLEHPGIIINTVAVLVISPLLSSSFSFSKRWSRKLQFPAGIFHCNPNILREEIDEEGIARGRFGEISNPQHYFVLSFCSWVG